MNRIVHVSGSTVAAAIGSAVIVLAQSVAAVASPVVYDNLAVDGRIATVSRPDISSAAEVESADDFVLAATTSIDHATFIGLLPFTASLASVVQVRLEIYRVFPKDSDPTRPIRVPTRVNSPSDVAFTERDSAELSFTTTLLSANFTALNSVQGGGINPSPNQTTGGNGPVSGQEVQIDVDLPTPFVLPADHYFFVPQVQLSSGDFFWLSASRPIGAGGTPFAPDLQSWIRDENLAPDWLRVGTDIVGGTAPATFNAAFALNGVTIALVPEPEPLLLLGFGLVGVFATRLRRRR